MKRLLCVSLSLACLFGVAATPASACPAVAVQSIVSGTAVAMPATVGVQTLSVPTVQTLSVPIVQVQTFAVPTTIAAPVVVQQVVRQRPVHFRSRTVTRSGFGLGLF